MKHRALTALFLGLVVNTVNSATVDATETLLLVACAPGQPGSTSQAQPAMDALVAGIVEEAGWQAGTLAAVYHEKEQAGLDALAADNAALALVPLPFYLEHREALRLEPLVEVMQSSADAEQWGLVAQAGSLSGPAALEGWTVSGMPGYSPRFVRNVALAGWGTLPASTEIRFSARVLSDLRRAAAGEQVAVLLDRAQADALGSLPFAEKLEFVTRSPEMAGHLLCSVAGRFPDRLDSSLSGALMRLGESAGGRELLESLRIDRFRPVDSAALQRLESAFAGGAGRAE